MARTDQRLRRMGSAYGSMSASHVCGRVLWDLVVGPRVRQSSCAPDLGGPQPHKFLNVSLLTLQKVSASRLSVTLPVKVGVAEALELLHQDDVVFVDTRDSSEVARTGAQSALRRGQL